MEWLNYHHLLYFWVIAREGSISKACQELRLAQPTLSGQLKSLEENLGEPLFERKGRGLELTQVGRTVFIYADKIFSLGQELQEVIRGLPKIAPLSVGIADVLPKHLAYQLLEPVRRTEEPFKLIVREGRPERLFADLALNNLDIILTDTPIESSTRIKAFSHLLGESSLSFFGSSKYILKYRKNFPQSLNEAPILLPSDESGARKMLDQWFIDQKINPLIVGEFADSALLQIFGDAGDGMFPAPTVLEAQLKAQCSVQKIGEIGKLKQKFYLISAEKKLKHPAVVAIVQGAKRSF